MGSQVKQSGHSLVAVSNGKHQLPSVQCRLVGTYLSFSFSPTCLIVHLIGGRGPSRTITSQPDLPPSLPWPCDTMTMWPLTCRRRFSYSGAWCDLCLQSKWSFSKRERMSRAKVPAPVAPSFALCLWLQSYKYLPFDSCCHDTAINMCILDYLWRRERPISSENWPHFSPGYFAFHAWWLYQCLPKSLIASLTSN